MELPTLLGVMQSNHFTGRYAELVNCCCDFSVRYAELAEGCDFSGRNVEQCDFTGR